MSVVKDLPANIPADLSVMETDSSGSIVLYPYHHNFMNRNLIPQ